ncbi:LysR family transcriptional regulator [Thiothrix eikelboomii]|uniref:LysR family transcriptional regulator n=1 Tax=Thiothrix eikelboomii TaxID=92487 RepID=UPI003BAF8AE9
MNTPDLLQLKRLAIFATVVEQGSFAKAAQLLQMSRSSVSEQVALLEQALHVRLLQRTTRQLTLTLEGKQVYPQAAQINGAMRSVKELVNQEQARGRVRITTTTDLALEWLNPKLQQFRTLYPEIYFDLVLVDHELDLVAEQIDLAIRIGYLRDESLVVRPLFQDKTQIIVGATYQSALSTPLTVETLQQQSWILLKQLHPYNQVTLQSQGQLLSFVPESFHSCDSPLVMRDMIQRGWGVGLHLPTTIQIELTQGTLELVLPEWYGDEMNFCIAYPSRRQLPLRVRHLLDYLLTYTG